MRELIADGYLAPARCFVPRRRLDLTGVKSRAGDYVTSDLVACIDQPEIAGDAIEQYRRHADHQPAIVYCCGVAHAERMAAIFRAAGYRAACIHGRLKLQNRDRLIAGLGTGEIELLTACDLISEGLDVPTVGAVILLRPTQSLTLYLQQVGRGMRPAAGKDALTVLDHAGNVIAHGLDEDRVWSLSGVETAKGRTTAVSDNGEAVIAGREIAEVADDLEELTADRLAAIERMSYLQVLTGRLSEAELRHYARRRGYKAGWVHYRLLDQRQAAP